MSENAAPEFFTVAETARILRLSWRTMMRRIADGSIPSAKIGHRRLIPRAAIEQIFMAAMAKPIGAGSSQQQP